MVSDREASDAKQSFQPLEIMGIFWSVFGVVVLLATFFVQGTPRVPAMRGIVTNLLAGSLLLAVGGFSIARGRANRKRKETVS